MVFENLRVKLQEGIHYDKEPFRAYHADSKVVSNDTFAMIFLRISRKSNPDEIKRKLIELWKMYQNLKIGIVSDLSNYTVPPGQLSILIGYGPNMFDLNGITKMIPLDFKDRQFLPGKKGAAITFGSGIRYSHHEFDNLGLSEDIVIQLISKTQLATYRCIIETKKLLDRDSARVLRFSKFYTGFQRDDGRSWLGFHDGVSNMVNSEERIGAIAIDKANNNLIPRDFWTVGGTYLAFLKIEINLNFWNKLNRERQELMVGRDKLTGAPIVGIDKKGKPVVKEDNSSAYSVNCFDNNFHDHPDHFKEPYVSKRLKSTLDLRTSSIVLTRSHVGRTRHIDNIDSKFPSSRRILRQGYEFLEPVNYRSRKHLRAGLNFISFQNDPRRLFFILTNPDWMGKSNFGGDERLLGRHKLLSALCTGVFFVPPIEKPYPGFSLFTQ